MTLLLARKTCKIYCELLAAVSTYFQDLKEAMGKYILYNHLMVQG